jgi:hypothetical protein
MLSILVVLEDVRVCVLDVLTFVKAVVPEGAKIHVLELVRVDVLIVVRDVLIDGGNLNRR